MLETYNEEDITEVEKFAALFFTPREIAQVLGKNGDATNTFCTLHGYNNDVFEAFQRGRLKQIAEQRQAIFELSKNGSSPAQELMLRILEKSKLDML